MKNEIEKYSIKWWMKEIINAKSDASLVVKIIGCQEAEYERGVEDGKIIAKHGTVNWIE